MTATTDNYAALPWQELVRLCREKDAEIARLKSGPNVQKNFADVRIFTDPDPANLPTGETQP